MKTFHIMLYMVVIAMLLHAGGSRAETSTIFAANYELEFVSGDGISTIQSRDQVRSGHEIPLEMQSYKVGLQIEDLPDGEFKLRLNVYQRDGMSWFHINAPAPEFTGEVGMPMEISWEFAELRIELAISVSKYEISE